MKPGTHDVSRFSTIKDILLFALLLAVVVMVNEPVISCDLMYQEQPSIYIANQTITSWQDLLNIFLHPAWLHINIPFFRPSGHFLIYQLITPFLGWHHTKAFTLISLLFLTGAGFFSIKLYQLLFPSFRVGGFVAFSIYLMHPSLSISRLTIMHFDFAYVFFLVLSLYLFVRFCRAKERSLHLFVLSLVFYAIAVTFKEPAIMLGPVLFCYFVISRRDILRWQSLLIMLAVMLVSLLLSWYLFLSWPSMKYAANSFNLQHSLGTANIFLKDFFALKGNYLPYGDLPYQDYMWRTTVFTPAARYVMWFFSWSTLFCIVLVCRDKKPESFTYQKSLLFLLLSSLAFMVLPLSWASGAPWHHSLTLICVSLMMGFSVEYICRWFIPNRKIITWSCLFLSSLIALIGLTVNFENIIKYQMDNKGFLGIALNRNAVLSPPDIKSQLNDDSILVVEDSTLHNDYFLGNAAYPFLLFLSSQDYDMFLLRQNHFYLKFHHTYSGNLFRYAYLMPHLKEELYPFRVEQMEDIPNEIIYPWLKNYNNIFCAGYDAYGNWLDKTRAFKKNLLLLQSVRQLEMNHYQSVSVNQLPMKLTHSKTLPFSDEQLCQYTCDQDKQCSGFIYSHSVNGHHNNIQCYFYKGSYSGSAESCANCVNYIKTGEIKIKAV